MFGPYTLLQDTCLRVAAPEFAEPVIIGNDDHRFLIAEQIKEIGIDPHAIILEPYARNTAPAALTAVFAALQEDENALILLLPSDHLMPDPRAFRQCVLRGVDAAQEGFIVTFGVVPDSAYTGYGYIEAEKGGEPPYSVVSFVEKPRAEAAHAFVDSGNHYWNAGIFLFTARMLLAEFEKFAPQLVAPCRQAFSGRLADLDFQRLEASGYANIEAISLDHAIMEKSRKIKCLPLDAVWSDLGSWSAIWDASEKDERGNAVRGDVILQDARGCYASADDCCLVLLGVEDILAIATDDAVLIARKDSSESVKGIVERLTAAGRSEIANHTRVYRPWGWYEALSRGGRFQVKSILVKPGGKLSLQKHFHRAEHWVVVSGTLKVTVEEAVSILTENESIYVPIGAKHRIENPGKIPALLIEVQSGSYLDEDDIVRFDDVYGRGEGDH